MSHSITASRQSRPMWVYEKNYAALTRLLPCLKERSENWLVMHRPDWKLNIVVLEQAPYTQFVELKLQFNNNAIFLYNMSMKIRIYHDAGVAEVISYQGLGRILPSYDYPNKKMLHKDEKRQANILLHDWLKVLMKADFSRDVHMVCPES